MDRAKEALARGLTLVDDNESETSGLTASAALETNRTEQAGVSLLALALKTMGQRALIAVDNLFTLVTVCLAFYLWHSIPDPNTLQVVALALFALFVLAANVIVRRPFSGAGWKR